MEVASLEDRFVGGLVGLAVGDALGARFEGQSADWLARRFASPAELLQHAAAETLYYTDDAQMAIGVAEALLEDGEIVESTLCRKFVENYDPRRGYGYGARLVLEAMRDGGDWRHLTANLFPGGSFGNGGAMRVAPVGLFFHNDLDRVWRQARLSALPTHVHPLGIEGAQLLALAAAVVVREEAFSAKRLYAELLRRCETSEFRGKLERAAEIESLAEVGVLGNGIAALDSVVTAIACFALAPDDYRRAVSAAIWLGGDTDTIAAMTGALSGAHLGVEAIPADYRRHLENNEKGYDYIVELAQRIAKRLSGNSRVA